MRKLVGEARFAVVATVTAVLLLPLASSASTNVTTRAQHRTFFAQGYDSQNAAYRPQVLQISADAEILVRPAKWSSWVSTLAKGAGALRVDNCQPNCAE